MNPAQINPGELRNRIKIQQRVSKPDAYGGQSESWTTVRETWAKILGSSSREVFMASQFTAQVTHMVSVRWSPMPVTGGMRVLFGTRVLVVQTVDNVKELNVRVNLLCLEVDGVVS